MQYMQKRQKPESFRTIGTCLKQISVFFNLRGQLSKSVPAQDLDNCRDNPRDFSPSNSATESRPSGSADTVPVWFRPGSHGACRPQ